MPVWGPKPAEDLEDSLDQVLHDLEEQVTKNPTFDQVVGIPLEALVKHATKAIAIIAGRENTELSAEQIAASVQLYSLGFVVGTKYGERRRIQNNTNHEGT